jgi:uncharacterized protein
MLSCSCWRLGSNESPAMARFLPKTLLLLLLATACQHQQLSKPVPSQGAPLTHRALPKKPNYNAALLLAAKAGDYAGAQQLLRRGASPNARGFYDMSPLLQAVFRHDLQIARLLLDHGADPNQPKKDLVTPVSIAAQLGDLPMTTLLVERGADVNRADKDGQTPLLWVAFYGHLAVADYLVQHGADLHAVDRFGQTPQSMAQAQHRKDMIAFLTSRGATTR